MKKTIAVIFGGRSAEHDVSIITAYYPIIDTLSLQSEFNVVPVYISKTGNWYAHPEMNKLSFFKASDYEKLLTPKYQITPIIGEHFALRTAGVFGKTTTIDVVFPAMHGTYGEDGSLPGLLRMSNVAYVGCDVTASAVAMDKVITKQVLESVGVPVTPYTWFTAATWANIRAEIIATIEALSYPVFIKPVHLGSSIGITKARNQAELIQGIEVALFYDSKVLVEVAVNPLIEVTLPMIGNADITFGAIEQPQSKSEFFDFTDKYISGSKTTTINAYSTIPAPISSDLATLVHHYGETTYRTLGCSGIARVDFLINPETGTVYVNEVNTLPGTLYVHNFKQTGLTATALVTKLVALAEEKHVAETKVQHVFTSTILSSIGGGKKF